MISPTTPEVLQAQKFSRHGSKFQKALTAVLSGGVKEHRFSPSGRSIFTVVGNLGDEFIDPEKPFCSCNNFFFRVATKREETCYHLLGYQMAKEANLIDVTMFDDEEYPSLLAAILGDAFQVLARS